MNHKYVAASNVTKVTPSFTKFVCRSKFQYKLSAELVVIRLVFLAIQCLPPQIHQGRATNPLMPTDMNWESEQLDMVYEF